MEGGIRIPSVPPAANTPVEKLSLYFSFFNSGKDFSFYSLVSSILIESFSFFATAKYKTAGLNWNGITAAKQPLKLQQ